MKAAVNTRYGPPEVVHVTEVADLVPKDDELLVRVRATSVTRTDCGFRAATPPIVRLFSGLRRPRRTILGDEYAGEVEAVGRDVTAFSVGDRVYGYDDTRFGGHAQYVTVAQDASVAVMPEGSTFEQMAVATEGAHYALSYLRKLGMGEGTTVMVYGATGAIGSAAVQLLVHLGARVTAVCATPYVDLVRGFGPDRVVDYLTEDLTADRQRYDVVFDAVGKRTFGELKVLLTPRGTYVSTELGPRAQNPLLALVTPLGRGRRVRFPLPTYDQAMIRELGDLVATGAFTPVIDRTYPLDDVVDAYRYVETGQKVGNVVITVD